MRRTVAAALLGLLLAGCGEPVFAPDAGPGAPGYTKKPTPRPPAVELVRASRAKPLPPGGALDSVVRSDGTFEVTGWALIDTDAPHGVLKLVLPAGVRAKVLKSEAVARPDVVDATGNLSLTWSGFVITVQGSLPEDAGVCLLSQSKQGAFRLDGSDTALCPA